MFLITGGRGQVATHLLAALHERRLPVRVGSAHPSKLSVPADVPVDALDLTDPTTFPVTLDGVDAVFLYASTAHITQFVDTALTAGVSHIVLLSSASVLGPHHKREFRRGSAHVIHSAQNVVNPSRESAKCALPACE